MEMPLRIEQQPAAANDGRVLAMVLAPGLFLAGLLYVSGIHEVALGLAGTTFVVAVLLSPEVGLYVYFAGQALDQILLADPQAILTPGKIIGPFVLLAYVLHPGRVRTPMLVSRPFVVAMLLFGLWGMVTTVWAIAPAKSIRSGAQIVVQVLILVVAIHRLSDRVRIGRAMLFTVLGATAAAVLILAGGGDVSRYGRATLSEFYDPNSAALGMAIGLFAIPVAWCCQQPLRIALLVAAPAIVTAIVMTGSRTNLVIVVATPVLSLLMARRSGIAQRIIIPAACVLVSVLAVYYAMESHTLTERSQARLEELIEGRVEVGREARMQILGAALKTYMSQPWGFAYGNSATVLGTKAAWGKTVHDNFFSVLLEGGPIAAVLFLYALWQVFRHLRRIRHGGFAVAGMMLFVALMLSSLTLYTFPSKYFWVPITFCMVLAEQAWREERQQHQVPAPAGERPTNAQMLRNLGSADAVVY